MNANIMNTQIFHIHFYQNRFINKCVGRIFLNYRKDRRKDRVFL